MGNWEWDDNPFVGTKELNRLRVMMALMNNWDLKTDNNTILEIGGREHRYLVSDLGGTFGKTGAVLTRSKGDMKDYAQSGFIKEISPVKVDFVLKSRPFFMSAVHVPYYVERTAMQKIVQDIPRDHVRWIGELLTPLPDRKIKDAFRAAGYSSSEVDVYAREVRERIKRAEPVIRSVCCDYVVNTWNLACAHADKHFGTLCSCIERRCLRTDIEETLKTTTIGGGGRSAVHLYSNRRRVFTKQTAHVKPLEGPGTLTP